MINASVQNNTLPAPSEFQCQACEVSKETSPWVWTSCQPVRHVFHKNCLLSRLNQQNIANRFCLVCEKNTVVPITTRYGSIVKVNLNINWPNQLLEAIRHDDLATVEQLLKNGADANLDGFKWTDPFLNGINAYLSQNVPGEGQSASKKVILTPSPLTYAVVKGNKPDIVKILLEYGACVSDPIDPADPVEPVFIAVEKGDSKTLDILLSHNGNPDAKCRSTTALHCAIASNNKSAAKLLIKAGADLKALDANGRHTCFQSMVQNNWFDLIIDIMGNLESRRKLKDLDLINGVATPLINSEPSRERTVFIRMYLSLLDNRELNIVLNQLIHNKKLIDYAQEQEDKDLVEHLSSKMVSSDS